MIKQIENFHKLITFFLLIIPGVVLSQKQTTSDTYSWIRYYNTLKINKKWDFHTEVDMRRIFPTLEQTTWLAPRLHIHYKPTNNSDIGLGASYLIVINHQNEEKSFRKEFRPHQEFITKQKMGIIGVNHVYRVEERFFLKNEKTDASFNMRFRYRLQFSIPLKKDSQKYKFKVFDEIFVNAGKSITYNVFDQNRIYAGFEYQMNKNLSTEIGYLSIFQQKTSGKDFYNQHIIRLTIGHTISLEK